jgi:hypothetical protein
VLGLWSSGRSRSYGDETLNAMSTDDHPGTRTSITRYEVPIRITV